MTLRRAVSMFAIAALAALLVQIPALACDEHAKSADAAKDGAKVAADDSGHKCDKPCCAKQAGSAVAAKDAKACDKAAKDGKACPKAAKSTVVAAAAKVAKPAKDAVEPKEKADESGTNR